MSLQLSNLTKTEVIEKRFKTSTPVKKTTFYQQTGKKLHKLQHIHNQNNIYNNIVAYDNVFIISSCQL